MILNNFFKKNRRLLAIETSCDDTALCIAEWEKGKNDFKIISNLNYSQIALHNQYGGVYPHMAKMEHLKNLPIILLAALDIKIAKEKEQDIINKLDIKNTQDLEIFFNNIENLLTPDELLKFETAIKKLDYIAVTTGPGLSPSLWTGIEFSKLLAKRYNIKIYSINHMEGHIFSSIVKDKINTGDGTKINTIKHIDKALALLISGGHTEIVLCENKSKKYNDFTFKKIGETLDDAVGECYDKTARVLGLRYPGGPEISKLSEEARKENIQLDDTSMILPRPLIHSKDYNFSFSGLKTSVINKINKNKDYFLNVNNVKAFCREFENAIADVLIKKIENIIIAETNITNILIGGGVSANKNIKNNIDNLCNKYNISLYTPDNGLSMDNAIMIASAAINKINLNQKHTATENIKAYPRWSVENKQ